MYTKYGIGMWLTQKELKEAKKHIGSQFDMALFLQCLQKMGYKTPFNAKEVEKLVYVFQCHFSHNQNPEKCRIPFAAITSFADPSCKFGLQFQVEELEFDLEEDDDEDFVDDFLEEALEEMFNRKPSEPQSAEIVSLDAFRKKHDS
jgi:hypothetical protein